MAAFGELKDDTFVAMTNGTFDPELRRPSTADIPIVAIKDGKFEVVAEVTPDYVPEPVR